MIQQGLELRGFCYLKKPCISLSTDPKNLRKFSKNCQTSEIIRISTKFLVKIRISQVYLDSNLTTEKIHFCHDIPNNLSKTYQTLLQITNLAPVPISPLGSGGLN